MESELSVTDVLTTEYVGVSESDTVLGAVRLMREERASCVLVVRGAEPVGIMTEWDVLELVADEGDPADTTVGDVMTTPVITLEPDHSLTDAATMMGRQDIRNVVIEDEDGVRGIVTQRDVIAAASSFQSAVSPVRSNANPASDPTQNPNQSPNSATMADPDQPVDERSDEESELLANGGDEYSTQGVCEACGSLADSLWDSNGQLVCADCRSV